jgi:prefoldin alpha subunit
VDIGTGYFVEKVNYSILSFSFIYTRHIQSVNDATSFYKDKVEFVKNNLVTLEKTITDKQSTLRGNHHETLLFYS